MLRRPPRSTLFPYTSSSDLRPGQSRGQCRDRADQQELRHQPVGWLDDRPDRKSTRLNSSHLGISYAVFCLKKKKRRVITTNGVTSEIADATSTAVMSTQRTQ